MLTDSIQGGDIGEPGRVTKHLLPNHAPLSYGLVPSGRAPGLAQHPWYRARTIGGCEHAEMERSSARTN